MATTLSSSPNPENYYIAKGFSYFGFNNSRIQEALEIPEKMMEAEKIQIYNVSIPNVKLISEQVLHAIIEIETDEDFREMVYKTYLVQQKRWGNTGKYTAFTEGNVEDDPYYIYEYIIHPPETWYITAIGHDELNITPITYIKAAIGFHSIYRTNYTKDMVGYFESKLDSEYGYYDGMNEKGDRIDVISDKTNSLIISAARYAKEHPFNLEEFPFPFVNPVNNSANCMLLTGASDTRGPCNASHTIDVAAGQYLAFALGRRSPNGTIDTYMDWEATSFNDTHVYNIWRKGNIATYGAPWVNLVTNYYHNYLITSEGESVLRAYMGRDQDGNYIYSKPTGLKYRMTNDYGQGKEVTDYAMIVIYEDVTNDRWALIVAGLSGYATREATRWLATFPEMEENHIILEMQDLEGDGGIDSITVVEPTGTVTISSNKLIILNQHDETVYIDGVGDYTLADFPQPFINTTQGTADCMLTPGACDPRGPCNPAHTIDVAAGQKIAFTLGKNAPNGGLEVYMDWETTSFNNTHVYNIWRTGNIITFGSPAVNTITSYYHNITTSSGEPVLPAYMDRDGTGAQGQYIYSNATEKYYRMINDYGQGQPVTDYAMITLHYDSQDDRYVLMVAGLSGYSTRKAAGWLSNLPQMEGAAMILELYDSEGDGQIENIIIKEIIYP
jgi:hypothetical protein